MYLVVPLSEAAGALLQFTVPMPLVFTCRTNPVDGDGHDTSAVFELVIEIDSNGEPAVGTTDSKLQKPPVSEKFPPLIVPASGWPIVPLTE